MKNPEDYMLPCPNKKFFGIDCPGCGLQRSVVMVSKGEFNNAFHMFPAVYTTILLVIAVFFHFILKKKATTKIILVLAVINVIIIIIAYILKMNPILSNLKS